jgi:hypothetical protein
MNRRALGIMDRAAEKSGWATRPAPRRDQTGSKVSGRGIGAFVVRLWPDSVL